MIQLPHIAWPMITAHGLDRWCRKDQFCPAIARGVPGQKVLGQWHDVIKPVAQGGGQGEPWALARNAATLDFEAFLATLAGMGPLLAGVLPRRPDDENELSDEVA